MEICKKYEQKSSFLFSSSKINKYYFIILTIILLFSLGGPVWVEISSNEFWMNVVYDEQLQQLGAKLHEADP